MKKGALNSNIYNVIAVVLIIMAFVGVRMCVMEKHSAAAVDMPTPVEATPETAANDTISEDSAKKPGKKGRTQRNRGKDKNQRTPRERRYLEEPVKSSGTESAD